MLMQQLWQDMLTGVGNLSLSATEMQTAPGGHLNKKMLSYQYIDTHVKDKMAIKQTQHYLTWESPKTVFILRRDPGMFGY